MAGEFRRYELTKGVNLYVRPETMFKTISMRMFLQQKLGEDTVSASALVPRVMRRGTERYSDMRRISARMEELYGARISGEVAKLGDRQIVSFGLDMPAPSYVGMGMELLASGVDMLYELVTRPALVDGVFRADYVDQEKDALARQIRALANDKTQYSLMRCVEQMFKGEAFGLHPLGTAEQAQGASPGSLYARYEEIVSGAPLDIFVVGEVDPDEIRDLVALHSIPAPARLTTVSSMPAGRLDREPREVIERQPVSQAKLTMGFRTYTTLSDPLSIAMLVFEGLLGGFPHSKLFLNVREAAQLAYYAQSALDMSKGLLFVIAGIDQGNFRQATSMISAQIQAMRDGQITEAELLATVRGLTNRVRSTEDSPSGMVSIFYDRALAGVPMTPDERIQAIELVTREQIVEAARRVELDAVHFLAPEGGDIA